MELGVDVGLTNACYRTAYAYLCEQSANEGKRKNLLVLQLRYHPQLGGVLLQLWNLDLKPSVGLVSALHPLRSVGTAFWKSEHIVLLVGVKYWIINLQS